MSGPWTARRAPIALAVGALLTLVPPAPATEVLPAGPVAKMITGPAGMRLLAPARQTACPAGGPTLRVAVRWSRKALRRPVRSVRVLLQRPGAEAVIDSVVFSPASPTTTRRAVLHASTCRANFDVRYELFLGGTDRPHDHTSVRFRIHGDVRARRDEQRHKPLAQGSRHRRSVQLKVPQQRFDLLTLERRAGIQELRSSLRSRPSPSLLYM